MSFLFTDKLKQAFNEAGCDKASKHSYHLIYGPILEELIDRCREQKKTFCLFEIGIYKGESLKAFTQFLDQFYSDYHIVAIDIFERIPTYEIDILKHPKIKWYKADSTDPTFRFEHNEFDLIIDDGSHFPDDQRKTFENHFSQLTSGGYYVIEDVWLLNKFSSEKIKSDKWLKRFPEHFNKEEFQKLINILPDHEIKSLSEKTLEPDSNCIIIKK